jgi:hypothetical protein
MHVKKEVLCCKFSIFNNYNFVCFRVFPFSPSIESTCICKNFRFFLKIIVKSSFSHPVFRRSGCRLSHSTGHISTRRLWRLEMTKSGKNPKCSFFLLQNPQWNQRMNSHEPCIWLKVKYSISWMESVEIFMGICIDLLKKRKQKLNIMQ